MRARFPVVAGLIGLLLAVAPALAAPTPGPHVDRGLQQLEQGGPVLPLNRPLPFRPGPRDLPRGHGPFDGPRDYVEPAEFGVLIDFDGTRAELEAAGIRVGTQAGRVFTARVRREEIGKLRGLAGMRKVQLSRYLRPHLNVSAVNVRADLEHAASGSPPVYAGRAGAGVIVGDVDTGIDFTSSDFDGADGTTRILYIWDQEDAGGTAPAGFGYGSEWTKSQIDNTPGSITHRDTEGHGTNVVGVMAGNGSSTGCSRPAYRYVGIAPEAGIIAVKTDFTDAGIIDGVNYVFQKAAALGRDAVVNISLGSQSGPHDGSDDFTTAIGALSGPGRIIVASAGNGQEDNAHAKLTTTSTTPGTDRFLFNVPTYSYNSGTYNDYVLIAGWYDPTASVVIQLRGPNAADTLSCGYGSWRSRSSGTTGCQMYIANMNEAEGFGGTSTTRQFEIEIYDATSSQRPRAGNWTVNVIPNGAASLGARVDAWIYASLLGNPNLGIYPVMTTGLDLTTNVGEPACGDSVIAVAAHATKASWYSCGSGATYSFNPAPPLNQIASFSAVGPRRDGVLKPEISAPGFGVATTHSSFAGSLTGTGWDVDDGVHEIQVGTSFSAPHVSGAAALYLQARPGATPSEVKLALLGNARADAYTGAVPNTTWGHGKLDIYAALDHVLPTVAVTAPNTAVTLDVGSSHDITWTATDASGVTAVDLAYSTDGGATFPHVIATGIANTGSFGWMVPDDPTGAARVRVTAHDPFGNAGQDVSDEDFTIQTASGVGGETVSALELAPVQPNPVRGAGLVGFALPAAAAVRLSVLDVQGREVATLAEGDFAAGRHQVRWEHSGGTGPGLYFVRLSAMGRTLVRRTVVVR
jgi:subtilisin family serine protease